MILRYVICCTLFFLFSCKAEDKKLDPTDLLGHWELGDAERDGKRTRMLNGAYLQFDDSIQLETNIIGDTIVTTYTLIDQQIIQKGAMNISYDIIRLTNDTLLLKSEIMDSKFTFQFLKNSK